MSTSEAHLRPCRKVCNIVLGMVGGGWWVEMVGGDGGYKDGGYRDSGYRDGGCR